MSENHARAIAASLANSKEITFGIQNRPTLTAVTPAAVISNEIKSNVASTSADTLQAPNLILTGRNDTAASVTPASQGPNTSQREPVSPATPAVSTHETLPSDPVTMIPLLQSRSSQADTFQKLLKKYLIGQVMSYGELLIAADVYRKDYVSNSYLKMIMDCVACINLF